SSRISSFWAVVKCPRLEERDGTSKDITDFSPRQYCQITVTRQPDTEGRHSGVGTQEWFRRCGPTISRPPSDWRESVQGLMGARSSLRNGRSRELQAGAASSPRGRMPAGTWLPAVLLLSPA